MLDRSVFVLFVILLGAVILRLRSTVSSFFHITASHFGISMASEKEVIQLNICKFGSGISPVANAAFLEEVICNETVFCSTQFQ